MIVFFVTILSITHPPHIARLCLAAVPLLRRRRLYSLSLALLDSSLSEGAYVSAASPQEKTPHQSLTRQLLPLEKPKVERLRRGDVENNPASSRLATFQPVILSEVEVLRSGVSGAKPPSL